ncbi:GNAT family N-acetyltransferase [Lentzea albidocapillata]|uniref:Acetyltransferase (GNAT) domain-containing protein n=1 Tax=Lentzea albidocapillata TaxID=40571 RepID=A0A1W2FTG6_9PSEU|nr:GNAT family N-acetyltransferase [Lentzea albidocapillata]SMD25221.1 Acetyltransferase (GNAT) domain-containing protein [Lentzea albidocapillata]
MKRRDLLKLGAASGALVLASPVAANATPRWFSGDPADLANRAWLQVTENLLRGLPRSVVRQGRNGTSLMVSFQPQAQLNGVFCTKRTVDLREVAYYADQMPEFGVAAWVMRVRGEASQGFAQTAAEYGKNTLRTRTLSSVAAGQATLPADMPQGVTVRQVTGAQADIFRDIAVRATGVPAEYVRDLLAAKALDRTEARPYLVEVNGTPAAIGVGFRGADVVAPYYLFTAPEFSGRGLDRLVTGRILRDAFLAGARSAIATIEPGQEELLLSLGFRAVDVWTTAA